MKITALASHPSSYPHFYDTLLQSHIYLFPRNFHLWCSCFSNTIQMNCFAFSYMNPITSFSLVRHHTTGCISMKGPAGFYTVTYGLPYPIILLEIGHAKTKTLAFTRRVDMFLGYVARIRTRWHGHIYRQTRDTGFLNKWGHGHSRDMNQNK